MKKQMTTLLAACLTALVASVAIAADPAEGTTVAAAPQPCGPESRIFLVKNSQNSLVALTEAELDAKPVVRRIGSVKKVQYKGNSVEVESTIIQRCGSMTVLDRYMPIDDDED